MQVHRIAIAVPNDPADRSLAHQLVASVFPDAITAITVPYDRTTKNFDAVARQVVSSDPQAVVELSYGEGAALTHALLGQGLHASMLVGGPSLFSPQFPTEVGLGVTGVDGMHVVVPGGDDTFNKNIMLITGNELAPAGQAYDCAVIIALAAEQAHSTDPALFASHVTEVTTGSNECGTYALCRNLIKQGKSIAYVGKAGPLRLGAGGEPTSGREAIAVFQQGVPTLVGGEHDYPVPTSS
jgi:branched-chain amino acid transport system substrate-binding protein